MHNLQDFAQLVQKVSSTELSHKEILGVLKTASDMLDGRLSALIVEMSAKDFQVVDPGHIYKLSNGETLTFVKKQDGKEVFDGTTNEELVRVFINRMMYLQERLFCTENEYILQKLEEVKFWLDDRRKRRMSQGIETLEVPHKNTEVR